MKSVLQFIFAIVLLSCAGVFAVQAADKSGRAFVSTTVVINEIYGGAGCGTPGCSTYNRDFIELKNISAGLVDISGWSVQYTSAAGSGWSVTPIPAGTILRPGDTYLIGEATGGAGTGVNTLPSPNASGTIAMSATAGKVALANTSAALTGTCPTGGTLVDFIGYGASANCNGSGVNNSATNAPAPSTTISDQRNGAGADTDNDAADFATAAPTPQAALQPTAASASIGGRVLTSDGNGISKVTVTLVDNTGQARTYLTNGFGYYSFEGLTTGETYTISVRDKRHQFNPSTRVVSLQDNLSDADFTAEP